MKKTMMQTRMTMSRTTQMEACSSFTIGGAMPTLMVSYQKDGSIVGAKEGWRVGSSVGCCVGLFVGMAVGEVG
jgi:hypothetical protein